MKQLAVLPTGRVSTAVSNKPWPDLSLAERKAKVAYLAGIGLSRSDQATRLGLRLTALSQFCSANGLTAGNDNTHSPWRTMTSAERHSAVAALLDDDLSLSEIAEEMGVTTGAISRFCRRAGLINSERRVRVSGPPMIPADPVPESTWDTLDGRQPVALMDLADDQCRWPVHGGFCGCTVAAGSYCAAHAKMGRGKRS